MNEFVAYILQFGNLNQQQIDLISSKATETTLSKDEYFWEAGKMVKQVGFLLNGVVRVCYYNNKGDEITRYFFEERCLLLEINSFENNTEPSEYVQAVTDCNLLLFSISDWQEMSHTILGWDSIIQKIFQKHLIQKLERRSPLVEQDATTRYLTFMEKFPLLANRIPLSYLASYLGITQQSLSRIRKNIR
ncbi:cAMP-binding domain of CRP or a regulatory subunit of cAMP-dependent protein kinases [Parapedobacter luteus]|uniref:cAMP-binding domain of CRP or a regulatory subunit of cAMP-dependent protein kinases n=1 Tax=Parapedobacter luteus TaxID=623280 RepID=A0A1T5CZL3_9SPHI|nr:Crp/Fnr family transcriptional regulator [Parapedobacter luteus]SKB64922.1 cAMP-binding domain of CRP or a regulatory subunit of cAMP-dependent protein kinases [Parapedobacter luteus]